MRSHMHHDAAKDLWTCELKVPRQMAPVTLGFVLWNQGVCQRASSTASAPHLQIALLLPSADLSAASLPCPAFLHTAADEFDGSKAGRHFALPIGHAAGKPYPLGPSLVAASRASSSKPQDAACTMNFAVSVLAVAAACFFQRLASGAC
jgi:hypothetical protein